jgi:hypothetical protein
MKISFLRKFSPNNWFPNISRKSLRFRFCERLNLRERQNKKGRTGQSEQNRQTGQAELDRQNGTLKTGKVE